MQAVPQLATLCLGSQSKAQDRMNHSVELLVYAHRLRLGIYARASELTNSIDLHFIKYENSAENIKTVINIGETWLSTQENGIMSAIDDSISDRCKEDPKYRSHPSDGFSNQQALI
ncbi:hypothetical protein DUI87_13205 [Hirundo rustica rustica]|uniref:Uncharacterized protein n=1 Tax=Hirundo rustica rustica TaxID=333673 RepID=A0A3M0KHG3_HIRRU|nr:hypothetical protein DUI87_13205 [Hirundo rustica rustica]